MNPKSSPPSLTGSGASTDGAHRTRTLLAFSVVGLTIVGVLVLAVIIVAADTDNARDVFNVLVPVAAAWVGTVLAFYFGRENFETANREMRELVRELNPDERAGQPVTAIMRPAWNLTTLVLDDDTTTQALTLADLKARMVGNVSRLPVLAADHSPRLMIHESRIDQYLVDGGALDDTLAAFLEARAGEDPPVRFDHGHGFVTVGETASVADVHRLLGPSSEIQDVFVTRDGTADGELLGWTSNVRLARYLPM